MSIRSCAVAAAFAAILGLAGCAATHSINPGALAAAKRAGTLETVTLAVTKMTCASCTTRVEQALMRVEGVFSVRVSLSPPRAEVKYDRSKVELGRLLRATSAVGFPSAVATAGEV